MFCFAEVQRVHKISRSACHILPYEDIMLTCKNSMLLCCMQSFLYLGRFLLVSVLFTPVLVMKTDA